jgi:hypothetical protein
VTRFTKGDRVRIRHATLGEFEGTVAIATETGRALVLESDALPSRYAGIMPVYFEDGEFRDLISGEADAVEIEKVRS